MPYDSLRDFLDRLEKDGELVRVQSRRGRIETTVRVTDIIKPEIVFMPFHFAKGSANVLTNSCVDPIAKIPEFKVCAVRIEKMQSQAISIAKDGGRLS